MGKTNNLLPDQKHQITTAILVDGGFYRKRARYLYGDKSPSERADELNEYCYKHLRDKYENRYLYRIFYYDCPPAEKNIYNPLTNKSENLKKSSEYIWMTDFLNELKHHRKFALRLGRLSDTQLNYHLNTETTKKLLQGKLEVEDISQQDLVLNIEQKGVVWIYRLLLLKTR